LTTLKFVITVEYYYRSRLEKKNSYPIEFGKTQNKFKIKLG